MTGEYYGISWNYIVSRMETRFGISPANNSTDYSLYDFQCRIDLIWQEYYKRLKDKYDRCRDCSYLVEKDEKWYCEDYNDFCIDIGHCVNDEV